MKIICALHTKYNFFNSPKFHDKLDMGMPEKFTYFYKSGVGVKDKKFYWEGSLKNPIFRGRSHKKYMLRDYLEGGGLQSLHI